MYWEKMGKIFDPTEHNLPSKCFAFAKSPQAIVFNDFIRVYFSAAEKDEKNKLLSHVLYVDFDKKFKEILDISSKEVISLGNMGCFDEHGIFPFNVYKEKNKIIAYTTGWNRKVSVSADASIGFAQSFDSGKTFNKLGNGPILTSSLNEPFLVGDAFVTKFKNIYHMWYIYGSKWINDINTKDSERVYKIAHADSKDGIKWNRDSKYIIPNILGDNECQALPTVIFYKNKYHMFFSYRNAFGFRSNKNDSYKTGYAYSNNLRNWVRDDSKVGIQLSSDGWDSEMMCYPFVFHCDDHIYMLYNGNEFGKYGFGLAVLRD
ncbi:MAG TPA: hypothetical protein VJZ04_00405 [Lachnospiraceae bacterium]|nr:hypothetical protein [Lachnospiraceae bacterium]